MDKKKAFISASSLAKLELPPTKWVVEGLFPVGLINFAGKPKSGKSWLMLANTLQAVSGGRVLDYFDVEIQAAIYITYEDSQIRIQDRLSKLASLCPDGEIPDNLFFGFGNEGFPQLNAGGFEYIKLLINSIREKDKDVGLVVIDTLGRGIKQENYSSSKAYHEEYKIQAELHKFAHDNNIALVLIHHTRKAYADDPFEEIVGTTALTGAADTLMVMKKDSKGNMVLYIRGRDLPEAEYTIDWNSDEFSWKIRGDHAISFHTQERQEILDLFQNDYDKKLKVKEISDLLKKDNNNVRQLINKLKNYGLILPAEYGYYKLAPNKSNPDIDNLFSHDFKL